MPARAVSEKVHISYQDALKAVRQEDARRINYCRHFTGTDWGIASHYGMTLHTSDYGLDNSVKLVLEAMNNTTCQLEEEAFEA